ncbi:hypothetical protein A3A66_02890 [Microgenomates group bacterium RIFCSPLOWO2_01_FULL_46_13]|nr:MAG: hypothetical protein A2783_05335 [Microgenomates group bacterium RIFCSPHIGHO2_01_FULL_45_11]OGV95120.1 MAG: hypothetical protein A3A66_02890 [Microgenomates group bacterium RIFCSPLOWO2_01_FULL_46_13]
MPFLIAINAVSISSSQNTLLNTGFKQKNDRHTIVPSYPYLRLAQFPNTKAKLPPLYTRLLFTF